MAKHFEVPGDCLIGLPGRVQAGNLVMIHEPGPQAAFVPSHLETRGTGQVFMTYLTRVNPQVVEPITGPALVVTDIDDTYVSPARYATNKDLPNVSIWDYTTTHVIGEVRFTVGPGAVLEVVCELTSRIGPPETLEIAGEEKLRRMARAIARVEVAVERTQNKTEASQNRHPDNVKSLLAHPEHGGEMELVRYLRGVALPHATERFEMIHDLRTGRCLPTSTAEQGPALVESAGP